MHSNLSSSTFHTGIPFFNQFLIKKCIIISNLNINVDLSCPLSVRRNRTRDLSKSRRLYIPIKLFPLGFPKAIQKLFFWCSSKFQVLNKHVEICKNVIVLANSTIAIAMEEVSQFLYIIIFLEFTPLKIRDVVKK